MKVAFLKPPIGGILGLEMLTFVEPLGPVCIAGGLEEDGHECRIFDLRIDGEEKGLADCKAFDPAIVGLQCNFTTERFRTLKLARRVREVMPGALIVVGGHDASRDPKWFNEPSIDVIAIGDGEEVMPPLVNAVRDGFPIEKVPGLVVRNPFGWQPTGPSPARRELDDLPMPARHLIKHYAPEYYINFRRPLTLMETARGCPFQCNFCSVWNFHESTFREKSPERVVKELQAIDSPNITITDDIFWMNVKRGWDMAKAIKAAGVKKHFTVQTRTDIICKFPDLIEAWKDCGQLTIFLGVEAISDEGLKRVNKKNTADKNNQAIEILKELNVGFTSNFIVDPEWDREDFTRLKDWIERTGAYNSGFSVLTPLPGTDLWDEARKQVNTHQWEMYDLIHTVLPTKLPIEEFYDQYAQLWRKTLEVRYQYRGKYRTYFALGAALATRKVSLSAVRKGMMMAKVFSKPDTFLKAHRELPQDRPVIDSQSGANTGAELTVH